MALRFTVTRVLPSALLFVGVIAAAAAADLLLHVLGAVQVGRWLGLVGTALILGSFTYSLRKRKRITWGQPRRLLRAHEILGWVGAAAVLVHAGIHFNAVLPWVAVGAMVLVVASGLTGRYLLEQARASLKQRSAELVAAGRSAREIDAELLSHSVLVDAMQRWRKVHMPLTMVFVGLALVHVATVLVLWRWAT